MRRIFLFGVFGAWGLFPHWVWAKPNRAGGAEGPTEQMTKG